MVLFGAQVSTTILFASATAAAAALVQVVAWKEECFQVGKEELNPLLTQLDIGTWLTSRHDHSAICYGYTALYALQPSSASGRIIDPH